MSGKHKKRTEFLTTPLRQFAVISSKAHGVLKCFASTRVSDQYLFNLVLGELFVLVVLEVGKVLRLVGNRLLTLLFRAGDDALLDRGRVVHGVVVNHYHHLSLDELFSLQSIITVHVGILDSGTFSRKKNLLQ